MPYTNYGIPAQNDGKFCHRDWSIGELSLASGWSENFIRRLMNSGELKAYKRGRVNSIIGTSVDEYRERNLIVPQPDRAA
jgi:hypothetical protein